MNTNMVRLRKDTEPTWPEFAADCRTRHNHRRSDESNINQTAVGWLIVNGYKDIQNRSWRTKYCGQVLIHASQGVKKAEYERAKELTERLGIALPDNSNFEAGGIVGVATITDCVE